jgi:CheY-like chemotaxis protein
MKLDAGLDVDLALLDITMPILDGAATLPHLRRLRPNLGVILAPGRGQRNRRGAHCPAQALRRRWTRKHG